MAQDVKIKDSYYLTRTQYNTKKAANALVVGAEYYIVDDYYAGSTSAGGAANKVANKLTAGEKIYDGSAAITLDASDVNAVGTDLGLATGDLVYWSAASNPERLAIGTTDQVLTVNEDGEPEWSDASIMIHIL